MLLWPCVHADRGTPRLPHSLWRPMMKLKFLRTSAPTVPTWEHDSSDTTQPFANGGGQGQAVWSGVWRWLRGRRLHSLDNVEEEDGDLDAVEHVRSSANDMERLDACYRLAHSARGGSASALAQLSELLLSADRPPAQRAAMHG